MTARGRFITFEGPEGSGKSTQLRLLGERLRKAGRDVLETQEPGGTPIGIQIRHVLLDPKNRELCPTTELLLTTSEDGLMRIAIGSTQGSVALTKELA